MKQAIETYRINETVKNLPKKTNVKQDQSDRLRKLLQIKKVRQSELVNIGLGVSSINQYVQGKTRVPTYVLHLLEQAYGLNKHWFYTGEGMMLEHPYIYRIEDQIAKQLKVTSHIASEHDLKEALIKQGQRMRAFLKKLGIRQNRLTDIGISSSMCSQYLHGRVRIPSYIVALLVFVYHLNPGWLATGEGEPFLPKEELFFKQEDIALRQTAGGGLDQKYSRMPASAHFSEYSSPEKMALYPIRHLGVVAAGKPIPLPEDWDGQYSWVNERFFRSGKMEDHYTLTVRGESMIDAGIQNNDQVIIRYQDAASHGQIAVVSINGEATLKQVFLKNEPNVMELRACNPNLSPILVTASENHEVKIHGVCIGLIRNQS